MFSQRNTISSPVFVSHLAHLCVCVGVCVFHILACFLDIHAIDCNHMYNCTNVLNYIYIYIHNYMYIYTYTHSVYIYTHTHTYNIDSFVGDVSQVIWTMGQKKH